VIPVSDDVFEVGKTLELTVAIVVSELRRDETARNGIDDFLLSLRHDLREGEFFFLWAEGAAKFGFGRYLGEVEIEERHAGEVMAKFAFGVLDSGSQGHLES